MTRNEVFDELFSPVSEESEQLTLDFLILLCCSSNILLRRQLEDQLPGGKFHQTSAELLNETRGAPKHNIVSKRDFAKLDAQLLRKLNLSTIAASGFALQTTKHHYILTGCPMKRNIT